MLGEIANKAIELQQTKTQFTANILVMKKQFEMDKLLINMIDQVSRSAPPPPGQGVRVDKSA